MAPECVKSHRQAETQPPNGDAARRRRPAVDAGGCPISRLQWEHIQQAMHETGGNVSAAARLLGMHRRSLQRKLAKRPSPERDPSR